jgi:hypothetical protein
MLEHAKGCIRLRRLRISASVHAVAARIEVAKACLTKQGLRVTGGPVFPPGPEISSSPDGELVAGVAGAGGAFIAFYRSPAKAQRLEPEVIHNAKRIGGRVERRGAVTVLWIRPPSTGARNSVEACAFG